MANQDISAHEFVFADDKGLIHQTQQELQNHINNINWGFLLWKAVHYRVEKLFKGSTTVADDSRPVYPADTGTEAYVQQLQEIGADEAINEVE